MKMLETQATTLFFCVMCAMGIVHQISAGGYGNSNNYQYAAVPYYGAWEFGYKRGNPYHFQERHEVGSGPHFKTKVRWGDKYGGYGEQYYDYNHADKGYGGGYH